MQTASRIDTDSPIKYKKINIKIENGDVTMKIWITLMIVLALSVTNLVKANYHVGVFDRPSFNANETARVLVIGAGDDLGLLFHEVAKGRALKYKEHYPSDQVLVIAVKEKKLNSQWSLEKYGFKVIRNEGSSFDGKNLVQELLKLKKIKSIDFFTHSTDQFGLHLNMRAYPFNEKTVGLSSLKARFTSDAYVALHGCNNGLTLAPFLSKTWGLPVLGSLTSTNFQKLHSDGEFYLTNAGKFPNKEWETTNRVSYDEDQACRDGACLRMRPENAPYVGYWGNYLEGGLPFYKYFCANQPEEKCLSTMAKTLLSHTLKVNLKKDSSFEDYKKAVVDYLCPVSAQVNLKGQCEEQLALALETKDYTYNPFSRKQLECNFNGCKSEVSCKGTMIKGIPKPGSCRLTNLAQGPATTIVREYEAYLKAYKYLSL